ncbi:hypothetical protein AWB82_06682 [Caballeronia glebae]|uniref:Uncharacterized protein n=1 Tax=Caballeronia glebae TaxID=1777143 RepID=A0A158DFB0_9BURK|nr:hypothetical protein AWB82_06682 [Caballeronia glebae]
MRMVLLLEVLLSDEVLGSAATLSELTKEFVCIRSSS